MKLRIPKKQNCKFVLLGGGYHICKFIEQLEKRQFPKPFVITWPKKLHTRDQRLLNDEKLYLNIFTFCDKYAIPFIETESTDDLNLLTFLRNEGYNIAFSLSWRYLIRNNFIDIFENRVFNIHPTLLPKEKGSGTFSYRIMNDSDLVAVTIHAIDETFDTGPIFSQYSDSLKIAAPIPYNYLIETNKLYEKALEHFLEQIENHQFLELRLQDESNHSYYTRLHTETNGAINWDWQINDLERFIRAFSDPYPGAFTFLKEDKLKIHSARIKNENIKFHPYLTGRVLAITADGNVDIIAKDGILELTEVSIGENRVLPSQVLKPHSILHTPNNILDLAKASVINVKKMK